MLTSLAQATLGQISSAQATLAQAAPVHTELAAHWGPGHWGGGGFGWLFLLIPLFWIGVFVLIFSLIGRRWRHARWGGPGYYGPPPWAGNGSSASSSAEKVLASRFAQGDIDEVEYRARLEVLRANRPDPGQSR